MKFGAKRAIFKRIITMERRPWVGSFLSLFIFKKAAGVILNDAVGVFALEDDALLEGTAHPSVALHHKPAAILEDGTIIRAGPPFAVIIHPHAQGITGDGDIFAALDGKMDTFFGIGHIFIMPPVAVKDVAADGDIFRFAIA